MKHESLLRELGDKGGDELASLRDKLDTADLKRNKFSARVTIVDKAGRTTFGSMDLKISPDGMKWVDVVVKRPDKAFEVTVYGTYVNMSDVPALPIIGPGMIPVFVKPPATMFLDPAIFVDYRRDIIEGIGKFWSRDCGVLDDSQRELDHRSTPCPWHPLSGNP